MSNDDAWDPVGGPFDPRPSDTGWPWVYEERAREIALKAAEWTVKQHAKEQREKADKEIAELMRRQFEVRRELHEAEESLSDEERERVINTEVERRYKEMKRRFGDLRLVENAQEEPGNSIYFEEGEYAEDVARALIEHEGRKILAVVPVAGKYGAYTLVLGEPE